MYDPDFGDDDGHEDFEIEGEESLEEEEEGEYEDQEHVSRVKIAGSFEEFIDSLTFYSDED